jgi:hypothetical protein
MGAVSVKIGGSPPQVLNSFLFFYGVGQLVQWRRFADLASEKAGGCPKRALTTS